MSGRSASARQRGASIATSPATQILGYFDRLEGGIAYGWVVNTGAPLQSLIVHVVIDDQEVGRIVADQPRDDIRAVMNHPTGKVGFIYAIPPPYLDAMEHRLSFHLPGGFIIGRLDPTNPAKRIPSVSFSFKLLPEIRGYVDGVRQGQFTGWVTRTEPGQTTAAGACHLRITCDGALVAQARADRYRGDVASATGGDPNCGFQVTLPKAFRSRSPRRFDFEVMPEGIAIEGSPITTSTVTDELEADLLDVSAQMDTMFRDFVSLRRRITDMVPQPGYNLSDYHRWAMAYYPALRARVMADRETCAKAGLTLPNPLVSILMPAYRPVMSDFEAAVESVLAQTYENWELVIVDDCSKDPALTMVLKALCQRDSRIRMVVRKRNGNISEATNTAIKAVRGEWVAFFDHDDLLVDVAIEMMVRAAQKTGAVMLFSDEDKIDQAGYYLEPNFKPDWNYRYVLGCNYVCHLLFIQFTLLGQVGLLHTKYNGAQDHDLILRLSEITPAEQIHHVPEMLYHWRKTPNSTATDLSRKSYAADAGRLAVSDHLARRGVPAKVETVRGLTLYNPVWQFTDSPRVCIIIPYKDQVEITQKCLNTVLNNTDYESFEVILVDNWSMTSEAQDFAVEAQRDKRVTVLRVEEPFNFSRLNNLAVDCTTAEYIVFMNNDLFPVNANWLRLLVNETLADPSVAAVGGRYLYPNDTVQHAGVVVGPRGIAAHVHRAEKEDAYGFIGRLALSNEFTVVTAACMLVRTSVFCELGGFDEVAFRVAYNDVDLCLRIRSSGYKVVYCAEMVATHHESLSRGSDDRPEHEARFFQEQQTLLERWGSNPLFQNDPAYNPHFTVDHQTFYDLVPPT